jgi:hypothetical protein
LIKLRYLERERRELGCREVLGNLSEWSDEECRELRVL